MSPENFGRRKGGHSCRGRALYVVRVLWSTHVVAVLLVLGALYLADNANDKANHATRQSNDTARKADTTARQAKELSLTQLQERTRNIMANCEDVNRRSRRGKALLLRLSPQPSSQRTRGTIALIDALTPERDCVAFAREQTTESRKKAK